MTLVESHHDAPLGDYGGALATVAPPAAPPAGLSVVVVDPQAAVREGLPLLLCPQGFDVLGVASTGAGGEALIRRHQPDVALLALELADVDGIVLLRRLVQRGVTSALVLYTDAPGGAEAALAVHAGAAGVVARQRTIADLADALRVVAAGGLWFNDGDAAPPTRPAQEQPSPPAGSNERRTDALSGSELRVLALVADGRSTEEAADVLSLSPHTVRTHLRNVMRKLEASSRAHAVAIAIREAAIQV